MRNLKKFLALVLAFMMAMSLMVTANAATTSNVKFSDQSTVEAAFEEDLIIVNGMGIIQGFEDGNFYPNRTITRAQMAAIVYRMATGDVEDKYVTNYKGWATEKFTDKNLLGSFDWASGYIGYCANAEYIVGYPDGTFHPEKEVTGYQALAMILRAMGYNHKGNNFEGSDWSTRVSETAQSRGMLVAIDKTSYGNALKLAAPRQLVAEMAFQGLTKAQVQWTSAYGYQTTGMDGRPGLGAENPSLGLAKFGLTHHKGIVVGNAYTGEGAHNTKIGFSLDTVVTQGLQIGDGDDGGSTLKWEVVGTGLNASINDNIAPEAYYYLTDNNTNNTTGTAKNVTLNFKWDSDLKLFNHAVDVWYNCNGSGRQTVEYKSGTVNPKTVSATFSSDLQTYAVFDRANSAVVAANNAATATALSATGTDNLKPAIEAAGMSVPGTLFWNYAFARMDSTNFKGQAYNTTGDKWSGVSPIKANSGDDGVDGATDEWPLYLVIDNDKNGSADVIITLDMTLSKVVQDNNTQKPESTGIITRNDETDVDTNAYFDRWDKMKANASDTGYWYSNIADKNRVDSYNAKLGDYVAAIAVTGTNDENTGVTDGVAAATDGNATAVGGPAVGTGATIGANAASMTSTFYYQLTQLTKKITVSMVKFDKDTQMVVVNDDGTVKEIERSVFALAVDAGFQQHSHVMAPTNSGTYTFYLDEDGNWLFWEQAAQTGTFVYGTYIDWQTQVASSTFRYPMVFTNTAGEEKLQDDITKIDTTPLSVDAYADIMLPKRDQVTGSNSGFVPGQYIGYDKNGSELTTVTTAVSASGFRQAGTTKDGDAGANWNDFGAASTTTVVDKDSLAIGAEPVGGSGNLFLTSRTKFIIVDGAGTANQSVKVYEGLADFLGTHKSVTINATTAPIPSGRLGSYLATGKNPANTNNYAGEDAPYKMVYYSLEQEPYAQSYDQTDKYIDTVFIPVSLVIPEDSVSGNLYFVGNNQYYLIDADNNATQYKFYQDGVESVLWITGKPTDASSDAEIVTTLGKNVFYQLHDTGNKAVDGGVIYELIAFTSQAEADGVIIGQFYGDDGTNTSDITADAGKTAVMADSHASTGYLATTRNSQVAYVGGLTSGFLKNISAADVLNLNGDFVINSIGDLNDQSSLTSNQGVSVSCVLNDNGSIHFIYVNVKP